MNVKTADMIREGCAKVMAQGLRINKDGAWLTFEGDKIVACDPIAATLIANAALPAGLTPSNIETLVTPGIVAAACKTLKVDPGWLYRFAMGFDRGYQVTIVNDKDKTEGKDDISAFGITLSRELFK